MSSSLPGSPPALLVGRERELALLRQHLDSTLARHGSLVLIGGEAGIGKTSLAETLCREATEQGALVLTGRCYDLTETPPYGPWVDLFDSYSPDSGRPALPAPFSQRGTVGPVASLAALFRAVLDFLTTLTTHRPLLLLLEDLHWTDPASLDLLRFLARSLARLPLLLLVTYRADELTRRHPLYTLLPLLDRESGAIRLDLHPLSPDAIHALVAARFPLSAPDTTQLVRYLHGRAEGNAFFTLQLLRALAESGAIRREGDDWILGDLERIHVPQVLRQVIDARLARLTEEAQHLLAVAAVIGQEVTLDLWAMVTGRDEDDLLAVIDDASVARIVEATEDGTRVRFVHALIREAVYEGTPSVHRRRLHARVSEALIATATPDPDAVVYHLRRTGDGRLVAWLINAAERARRASARASAIAHYEEALLLLPASVASVCSCNWRTSSASNPIVWPMAKTRCAPHSNWMSRSWKEWRSCGWGRTGPISRASPRGWWSRSGPSRSCLHCRRAGTTRRSPTVQWATDLHRWRRGSRANVVSSR
jgi:predicted ATPase